MYAAHYRGSSVGSSAAPSSAAAVVRAAAAANGDDTMCIAPPLAAAAAASACGCNWCTPPGEPAAGIDGPPCGARADRGTRTSGPQNGGTETATMDPAPCGCMPCGTAAPATGGATTAAGSEAIGDRRAPDAAPPPSDAATAGIMPGLPDVGPGAASLKVTPHPARGGGTLLMAAAEVGAPPVRPASSSAFKLTPIERVDDCVDDAPEDDSDDRAEDDCPAQESIAAVGGPMEKGPDAKSGPAGACRAP